MTGRKAIVSLCMLCALFVSAFASQSASAATNGTTAFTCQTNLFSHQEIFGDHCLKVSEGGSGTPSEHIGIAANTTTKGTLTNANTASGTEAADTSVLKATIAGTPLELTATGVSGEGTIENKTTPAGEHMAFGEATITYTGVTVTKPEGKGCKVYTDNAGVEGEEGVVHTNKLKGTTEGQGDLVKFEPKEGTVFASFWVTCSKESGVPEALEGKYTVTGSVKCPIRGATIVCVHEEGTTQNTLKTKGVKAGIKGSLTLIGQHPGLDPAGSYKPISTTTVQTP